MSVKPNRYFSAIFLHNYHVQMNMVVQLCSKVPIFSHSFRISIINSMKLKCKSPSNTTSVHKSLPACNLWTRAG